MESKLSEAPSVFVMLIAAMFVSLLVIESVRTIGRVIISCFVRLLCAVSTITLVLHHSQTLLLTLLVVVRCWFL